MDVGSFVQENKRWLLGCAIGAVAFFIGRAVVASVFDPLPLRMQVRQALQSTPAYDKKALQAATDERQALDEQRTRLSAELGWVQDPKYQLEGQGLSPDEYLGKVGRERKLEILKQANERDVQTSDKDVAWPPTAQGVDEIRGVLFGIELVDAVCARLFAAHDAVRQRDPQAIGLTKLRAAVESHATKGRPQRTMKAGEVDVREFFDQERVKFDFMSDEATALQFLESLRQAGKALTLEAGFKMTPGRRGEPLTVTGTVIGIAFKAPKGSK